MPAVFDQRELLSLVDELNDLSKNLPQAKQRALSTLARRLPPEAKRQILKLYTVKSSKVSSGLSSKVTPEAVELRGSGKGISLIDFNGRYGGPSTPGAVVQVLADGGPKTVQRTFIPKFKNPNQIFIRQKLSGGAGLVPRLPVLKLWGPSVGQMLKNPAVPDPLADIGQTVLLNEIARLTKANG